MLMRIMRQHNRPTSINLPLELLKTNPVRISIIILIILRVNTSPNNMVSQIGHGAEDDGQRSEKTRIRILQNKDTHLTLPGALLRLASLSLLSLTVKELALLVGAQSTQDALTLILLDLLGGNAALLGLLFLVDTAQLLDLLFADVTDLAHDFATEVGGGDQFVGQAQELVEQRESGGIAGRGGGEVSRELDTLLGDSLVDPGNTHLSVDGLVRHDQVLKVITSLLNGLDQLRGEEGIANLGTLGHHGDPRRELGVVLRESDGGIVAVVAELAHVALVNNSPDEAVVSRTRHLNGSSILGENGNQVLLLTIESIQQSLVFLNGGLPALKEEAENILHDVGDGVVSLGHLDVDVEEGNVLAASRIRSELRGRPLLQQRLGVGELHGDCLTFHGSRSSDSIESDDGKLLLKIRSVGLRPVPRLTSVLARSPQMEEDNQEDDGHDHCLLLEVARGCPLPYPVPGRVGDGLGGQSVGSRDDGRVCEEGGRRRVGSFHEVGEVYQSQLSN
ncbi:hypothetical protein N7471_009681 [Penicillium samsonianum]|uniref:uncharacterized protein n=1 Tax=Penicillium samsonianum TaxID=1882272 RepID=UPI0025494183|nr:uncharacterized protein N7471_009681 [Penicillium samsonianum]KAJ6128464.1 hypothetical protein N7471_009681 [Penicillium samsonianum]